MNNSTICTGIPADPDISGIGIRINFYATIFITAAVPRRRSTQKLIDALNVNAGVTGFSLLITAIMQTLQNRLDLYHAIFVSYIVYYLALIVYFSGVFRWTLTHIRLGAFIQIMTVLVYLAWSVYIAVHARTFGSSPQCNSRVQYILFDHPISATTPWWRKFWVIFLCITTVWVVIGIIAAIFITRWASRKGIRMEDFNLEKYYPRASRLLSVILLAVAFSSTLMLELFIARNKHLILPGETKIVFGQVLSFVMIVASLNEVLRILANRIGC
ncbi:hypothetical protein BJV78DRAFT_1156176 [Lactifluus subvellereus]|nr:hypothetical protein BJV78DRAFT_1156176 [Lactifluus subvellereus]